MSSDFDSQCEIRPVADETEPIRHEGSTKRRETKDVRPKAIEVLDAYGLDDAAAVDALVNGWFERVETIEILCSVIDRAGNVADFQEFLDCSYPGSVQMTAPTLDSRQDGHGTTGTCQTACGEVTDAGAGGGNRLEGESERG